jgi:putative transposase
MSPFSIWLRAVRHCVRTAHRVVVDLIALLLVATKSRNALAAEILFLRKQLALFHERDVRPHGAEDSARWLMAHLSWLFDWLSALAAVKPDTLIRWHRKGFRLLWRWKSKPTGRPTLPKNLQEWIRRIAAENPTWGEEHIANELKVKLGVRVSPCTVRKYLANYRGRTPDPSQRWLTFVHNQAQAIVACDFFVHSPIPYPLCTGDHGTGQAPDPSSQRDGASEC